MRVPKHLGIIPDGNRRWALDNGLTKEKGYKNGLNPGLQIFKLCEKSGIKELTFYGFTMDNTKRPTIQRLAFSNACVEAVKLLSKENAELLVIGNTKSPMFPKELLEYTGKRKKFGNGGMKVNFLVNYDWKWDIGNISSQENKSRTLLQSLKSRHISRVDLIIRWGGRRRLSGFLPLQAVYADFYVVEDYWPDFKEEHFYLAMDWYNIQDITLGG